MQCVDLGGRRIIKKLHLNFKGKRGQNTDIVMMTTEGSTKIVNFMTPGAGVLAVSYTHLTLPTICSV